MNRRIKRVLKKRLLLFLGLELAEIDIWDIRAALELNELSKSSTSGRVISLVERLDLALPMIEDRLRALEDKLSLIQEAAKPKEEKVIRHRRASEFKQAVERGLHQ